MIVLICGRTKSQSVPLVQLPLFDGFEVFFCQQIKRIKQILCYGQDNIEQVPSRQERHGILKLGVLGDLAVKNPTSVVFNILLTTTIKQILAVVCSIG